MDLESVSVKALEQLGGRSIVVPGAKLALAIRRELATQGLDFSGLLRSRGQTFKSFIQTVKPITVIRREGSDIGVTLRSAEDLPAVATTAPTFTATQIPRQHYLRKDVYLAFTRMSTYGYSYLLDRDTFVENTQPTTPSSLSPVVSPITLENLIDQRKSFAATLETTQKSALCKSLESSSALRDFALVASGLGLDQAWRAFQSADLRRKIEAWATKAEVVVREEWLSPRKRPRPFETAPYFLPSTKERLLKTLEKLSEKELASILIPLGLVERLNPPE